MTEIRTQLQTFRIEKVCDTCSKGQMVATGFSNKVFEESEFEITVYDHVCNNAKCGAKETFPIMYPTTETIPMPETKEEKKVAAPAEKKAAAKKGPKKNK